MKNFLLFLSFTTALILSSCSPYKDVSYFQDLNEASYGLITDKESAFSLIIQPDDELSIIVSAPDPSVAAPYNLPLISVRQKSESGIQGQSTTGSTVLQTYLVDSEGLINFPGIGKIKVAGMTKDELTIHLTNLLKTYIEDPMVNIQIVNFRVSVLGEVNVPGLYSFNKQRVSVLEALASAQDMTIHGERKNVMIARNTNGKIEYFKMDLTKSDIFQSPFYYLQQNDVVYVVPNKEKQRDAGSGEQKSYNTSIIISAISTVISVIAIVIR